MKQIENSKPTETTIPLSPVAALFQQRWNKECENSLLLAVENDRLRQMVGEQKTLIDNLEKLVAEMGGKDGNLDTAA